MHKSQSSHLSGYKTSSPSSSTNAPCSQSLMHKPSPGQFAIFPHFSESITTGMIITVNNELMI